MYSYSPSYQPKYSTRPQLSAQDEWFELFIGRIRKLQFLLNQHKDNPEVQQVFETLQEGFKEGNEDQAFYMGKQAAQRHFVKKILIDYLELIKDLPVQKLAVHYSASEVLVWAVLNDDDWDTERSLIRAQAKINAKYYEFGFSMSSLYMEVTDDYTIPPHYLQLK